MWHIGFEGQDTRIRHLDGFFFIGYLLEKLEKSISCRKLYQAVSGKTPDKTMTEGAAIDEGLNIGRFSKQVAITAKEGIICRKRYQELKDKLPEVETTEEREEIEEEMKALRPYLKKRYFADPNDKKAQSNVGKRLDTAYEAISKAGLKKMAKHL